MKNAIAILGFLILAAATSLAEEPSFANLNGTIGGYVPLPHAMVFEVALASGPDNDGEFIIACRTISLLDDVKVAIKINPSEGVRIMETPRKLRGRARKDKVIDFYVKCKVTNEHLASGVNVELRYIFPYEAAAVHVDDDPHLRYGTKERQEQALMQLAFMQKSGRKVFKVDRAVLLD